MPLNVEEYVNRLRDSNLENELAVKLRELPEDNRFQFISQLLDDARPSSKAAALAANKSSS